MATSQPASKGSSPILFLVVFIAGFLAGVGFAAYKMRPAASPSAPAQENARQNDQQIPKETAAAIAQLEDMVTRDPKDYQSWIKLGHHYYDTDQPEKAIQAYTQSLTLHSGDANLLTDLGVMYRATGQKEKAIESFDKARAMDPKHEPSRLNKGIVMLFDLNDPAGAIASWEELLRLNPEAKMTDGSSVREFVGHIKDELAKLPKQ
jgi:cytochrome c-type biogenesis protein CcmH/NrfG